MPAQRQQSALISKLGTKLDAAIAKHAGDEINYGLQGLPAGISNGIAQLQECYFNTVEKGKDNAGALYWRAMGIVVDPETNDRGVPIKGLQTSIMVRFWQVKDSKGNKLTDESHIAKVMNELKKMIPDCCDSVGSAADLEEVCKAVSEAQPYFRFSTEQGKETIDPVTKKVLYEARVWERWHGSKGLENYVPPDSAGAVVDNSAPAKAAPARNGTAKNGAPAKSPAAATAKKPTSKPAAKVVEEEPPAEEFNEFDDGSGAAGDEGGDGNPTPSLAELVEQADQDTKEAQDTLTDMALKAGASKKQIQAAKTWQEVADIIEAATDSAATEAGTVEEETEAVVEEATEEEDGTPAVGSVYHYHPVDKTTKKPTKDPIEVEVKEVNASKETVDALNLTNGKTLYKGIPWSKLVKIQLD